MKVQNRGKEKTTREDQIKLNEYLICHMCDRKIEANACNWQEDDEGAFCCYDCIAERDSCGCSD